MASRDNSLLYEWPGRDVSLAPIILMAHQDVVPAGSPDRWTHPPFSGTVTDAAIFGRGAIDNKGSLVAMLEAAEALVGAGRQPARTVFFVFGHDEETRGSGAAEAARLLAGRGVQAQFVLDEGSIVVADHPVTGGAVALVGITEKGYATVRITARADGGHASAPPERTAVAMLAQALDVDTVQRLDLQQAVDEKPVALRGRYASGRRMRRGDQTQILQIRHHVADRRRAEIELRIAGERLRADGLAVANETLDQYLQQVLGAFVRQFGDSLRHGDKSRL